MAEAYGLGDYQDLLSGLDYSKKNNRMAAQYIMRDGMNANPGAVDGVFGKNTSLAFQQAYKPSLVAQTVQQSTYNPSFDMENWSRNTDADTTAFVPQTENGKGFGSYLGDAWSGTKDTGKSIWSALTPTSAADTYAQHRADWLSGVGKDYIAPTIENGIMTNPGSGTSFDEYVKQSQAQQGVNNQQWAMGAQALMGAGQLGLGALSYFDNRALNKKNIELMDQQIDNNKDIMQTRRERAGDIKKYFG